jgi:hypothetical protein
MEEALDTKALRVALSVEPRLLLARRIRVNDSSDAA